MNLTSIETHELSQIDPVLFGKELILKSATHLFVANGFNGVSMREIAEASQMTKAALYYHFKDKEDLINEIFFRFLAEMELEIRKIQDKELPTRQKIWNFITKIMYQSSEKLGVIHLVFIESAHLDLKFRQEIGQKYHALFLGSIEEILEEGIKKNEIGPINTKQASQLLFGMLYAFFHPQQPLIAEEVQATTDLITQVFFEGVKNHPEF